MKKIFLSAILAGMVIGFGGTVFLSVENTVVGSIFFTIGLFVVCTHGLHLFTGKVCYVFDNDLAYAKTLPVIWLGNLAGASLIALAEKCTRLVSLSARAQGICELKLSEPLFGASIVTAGGITFDCNLFPPESGGNANLFYDGEYMYQPLLLFDGQ